MKKFIIAAVLFFAALNAVAAPDAKVWELHYKVGDNSVYLPTTESFDSMSEANEELFVMQILVAEGNQAGAAVLVVTADDCKDISVAGMYTIVEGTLNKIDRRTTHQEVWVNGSGTANEDMGKKLCSLYRARLYHAKSVNM